MAEHVSILSKLKKVLSSKTDVWDRALNGQPEEIRQFFSTYTPDNKEDSAIYSYIESRLLDGESLDTMHLYLAWIGDGPLLEYLFQNHMHPEDKDIRQSIVENKQCPVELIEKAMWDESWEVSKAAIHRPEITLNMCLKRAEYCANAYVVAALNKRLEHFYAQKTTLHAANRVVEGKTEDINVLIEAASFRSGSYNHYVLSEKSRKMSQVIEEPFSKG